MIDYLQVQGYMKRIAIVSIALLTVPVMMFAGNKDRAGEAGASELLINPWTRSSGFAGANSTSITGLEAVHSNVAGLAFTTKTELIFSHTRWLSGSGININTFGFSQKLGATNVIGLAVMSMDFGDIQRTTVDLPEGGIGTFSPGYNNIGLSFAKEFSNSIYGGATVKVISEGISNAKTSGVAFDAAVKYVTGENDQIKFGIALRNIGPPLRYSGDGLSVRNDQSNGATLTQSQLANKFEMPSLLNIGASYDIYVSPTIDTATAEISADHRVTLAATYQSNSFTKDAYRVGAEYAFKSMFMVRGGYVIEQGVTSQTDRTTAHTGPCAGMSVEVPIGKGGSTFSLDYAYRFSNPFSGSHTIGARINL